MKQDAAVKWQRSGSFRKSCPDLFNFRKVPRRIVPILRGVCRVGLTQSVTQVFHLPVIPAGACPDMLIDQLLVDFTVLMLVHMPALQQRNTRRSIHHRQLRELAARAIQKCLGSRTVDHQHIRLRESNHVIRRQLEIMPGSRSADRSG